MTSGRMTHTELAVQLARAGAGFGAAEVHGIACGLLAGDSGSGPPLASEVLPGVPDGNVDAGACREALQHLEAETRADLADESFRFTPLLAEESAPLQERAASLREWCEGFLYGLGLADALPEKLPPELAEALEDISELTRLDVTGIEESESDEQSFFELVEFIRVATLLIRDGLSAHSRAGGATDT